MLQNFLFFIIVSFLVIIAISNTHKKKTWTIYFIYVSEVLGKTY